MANKSSAAKGSGGNKANPLAPASGPAKARGGGPAPKKGAAPPKSTKKS